MIKVNLAIRGESQRKGAHSNYSISATFEILQNL